MKTHFLILAFICLFSQSEARLFRGSVINKFLKSAKKAVLKESIDKVYGNTTFTNPTHEGDTPHARAEGLSVTNTADIIQVDITNGLRGDFQFIRDSLTAFADPEGFVREGLVFCGGATVIAEPSTGEGYSPDTGLLNMIDGYGNTISQTSEKTACSVSGCDEGSFVSLLANRIRALGYHVTHSDICMARTDKPLDAGEVPTGRTCMLQRNEQPRTAYKMNVTMFNKNKDFFLLNKLCYKAKKELACGQIELEGESICRFDKQERMCQVSDAAVKYAKVGDTIKGDETIKVDSPGVMNGVRRVVAFSIREPGSVPLTDYVHVTGTQAINGTNGCKSLRQYVSALNGVAQINAFRDVTIQESDNNWLHTIKESRTFIEGYASILSNFYDKSLQMFPDIENEDFESCPTGDVKKDGQDSGSQETPLCDNKKYDTATLFNSASANSQAMVRNKCFCRMGSLGTGTDKVSDADIYEADEFYLAITASTQNCSAYEGLPSVHQYCKLGNFEIPSWKKTLESLEPHETSIRVYSDTNGQRKADIYKNLKETLPLISHTPQINCGRLVSADGAEMKYSNKGGNCVPFKKMHDLLYRLEFETSGVESGTQRGSIPLGFAADEFGSRLCGQSDTLASTLYTFRQLSYQWDHARDTGTGLKSPIASDKTADWTKDETTQVFNATALQNQLFSRNAIKMCNIDWTQELTGQTERKDSTGGTYADPYLLFDREIKEAIFNLEVAVQAKKDNVIDNENLWRAIETELTSVQPDRINYGIAIEAAEHFMRIVTTDEHDAAVDSGIDNDGAKNAATESPTTITNTTAST